MNDALIQQEVDHQINHTSYIHALFDRVEHIFQQHRFENPDLYRMVEERKLIKEANQKKAISSPTMISQVENASVPKLIESIYFKQYKQAQLKTKIEASYEHIRKHNIETQSLIVRRTQARNAKQPYSIEEMTTDRENKLSEQIKAWRSILPILIGSSDFSMGVVLTFLSPD